MHYCVFVMIEPNTDIESGVAEMLAPFNESLDATPYRVHLDHSEVVRMARYYGIEPANLHALAQRMPDWRSTDGGVDREGLFAVSICNPDGRWDWYEVGGRWTGYIPHSRQNSIRAGTLGDADYLRRCLPAFLVTPDGDWLEHERCYFANGFTDVKTEAMEDETWLELIRDTLAKWPDHLVVCVDIHS
jgi:hypothetical protein